MKNIPLTLFERVVCERELETEQNCNIFTPTLLAIMTFLYRSPGLLNRGPGGPASLGAGFLYRILSPTRLIPNWSDLQLLNRGPDAPFYWVLFSQQHHFPTLLIPNWLNFLCTELYNSSTSIFFLWASQFRTHSTCPRSRILLTFDRMHMLFTQAHFQFWRPRRVVRQYTIYLWSSGQVNPSWLESVYTLLCEVWWEGSSS